MSPTRGEDMSTNSEIDLTPEQARNALALLGQIESGQCQVVDVMTGDPDTEYDEELIAQRSGARIEEFVIAQARRGATRMPRVIIIRH